MFISSEEVEFRLNSNSENFDQVSSISSELNQSNLSVVEHQFRGRTPGRKNIPEFLRPVIAASAHLSGNKATMQAFGTGPVTTSHYKNGKIHSHGTTKELPELKKETEAILGRAQETAVDRLMSALGLLTDERIAQAKTKDISSIAADMSRIIEKTTPKQQIGAAANIVIYAPQQRTEDKYEVIEVHQKKN